MCSSQNSLRYRQLASEIFQFLCFSVLHLRKSETTIACGYDCNQIPYDYTAEMINKFKGLDMADRVHEELLTEVHNIVQRFITM